MKYPATPTPASSTATTTTTAMMQPRFLGRGVGAGCGGGPYCWCGMKSWPGCGGWAGPGWGGCGGYQRASGGRHHPGPWGCWDIGRLLHGWGGDSVERVITTGDGAALIIDARGRTPGGPLAVA